MISRRSIFLLPLVCCAHAPTLPAVDPRVPPSPIWQKRAVDLSRDVVITADLRTLLADSNFAPATRKAMRASSDRAVRGANLIDAWEGARGAEVAFLQGGPVVLVLTEVPDIDPESLAGFDAAQQWKRTPESPPGTLEFRFLAEAGSLFVLADRTWVIGAGIAAQPARAALQEAGGHPAAQLDLARPLSMLVPEARLRVAEKRARRIGSVFDGLKQLRLSATLTDAILECDYDGDRAATNAETTFQEIVRAFRGNEPGSSSIWQDILSIFGTRTSLPISLIGQAKLEREGTRIRLQSRLPPEVLDALASAENGLF